MDRRSNTSDATLVMLSVLLVPLSLAACRSVAPGASGAWVSIVVVSVSVPTLPSVSVNVTSTG